MSASEAHIYIPYFLLWKQLNSKRLFISMTFQSLRSLSSVKKMAENWYFVSTCQRVVTGSIRWETKQVALLQCQTERLSKLQWILCANVYCTEPFCGWGVNKLMVGGRGSQQGSHKKWCESMSKKTSADFSDVTLVSEYTCADNEDRRPLLGV